MNRRERERECVGSENDDDDDDNKKKERKSSEDTYTPSIEMGGKRLVQGSALWEYEDKEKKKKKREKFLLS